MEPLRQTVFDNLLFMIDAVDHLDAADLAAAGFDHDQRRLMWTTIGQEPDVSTRAVSALQDLLIHDQFVVELAGGARLSTATRERLTAVSPASDHAVQLFAIVEKVGLLDAGGAALAGLDLDCILHQAASSPRRSRLPVRSVGLRRRRHPTSSSGRAHTR